MESQVAAFLPKLNDHDYARDLIRAASNLANSEGYFRIVDQSIQMNRRDELMAAEIIKTMPDRESARAVFWGHNAHAKTRRDSTDRFVPLVHSTVPW